MLRINSLVFPVKSSPRPKLKIRMDRQQEQLIQLLINNAKPAWEIEAIHTRCCIFYGTEKALEESQGIIDFAEMAGISLLESFRLQLEVAEVITSGAGN
jgi:hypothetical protein